MSLALVVGIPLGIFASLRPGSVADRGIATFALVGLSLPQFWLGAMLIMVGSVALGWFPTAGTGSIDHIVLPAITLALPLLGRIAQMTRTTMIDELASQHILAARAKGLQRALHRHAPRAAQRDGADPHARELGDGGRRWPATW